MNTLFKHFAWICVVFSQITFVQTNVYFATHPSLSPGAQSVVFAYESDLWKTDLGSGITTRLTAMQGNESRPRISPDGQWLAFSGTENGNADVYLMPLAGGVIRQLAHHSTSDLAESWSWDSQTLYFESSSQNGGTAFTISIKGGTPKRVFKHYFNRLHNIAESPTGELFFNDTWESDDQAMRKGIKANLILIFNLTTPKTLPISNTPTTVAKTCGQPLTEATISILCRRRPMANITSIPSPMGKKRL